jgi:hypothetical protein
MLHEGHVWVRLSAKLAAAFGMSYRQLWNEVTSGNSGLSVLRVPTRNARRRLAYIRLDEINTALGYPLHDPPTLTTATAHDKPEEGARDADHT